MIPCRAMRPHRGAKMKRANNSPINPDDIASAGGLLGRRAFLTAGLAAGALGAGAFGSAARTETLTVPSWMKAPGSPFAPYGEPSRYETKTVRTFGNPPNAPGT